ncbi:molybdate ABC transporter substrate-binding protein [Paraglaciecola aquimarina]|uniref:Molybdate ABC transporter substrate-binding protein n=1 Tax=Paraglaciecola algarum TaxID=3050085 RepID=A0ABS9DB87_9ALTE|nr:molybdate ABC transporter substrate-binding protein [Paraglaciecola sp. G1-23]MCF2949635.1 molybdate ABC transporter substrate-binding protein [Paraglaciecola sp. G1-23]
MPKIIGLLILNLYTTVILAETFNGAVASNFAYSMKALVHEFEKGSSHTVNLSFGSSGKIYAQIVNGAPFDMFFSADQVKPLRLQKEGWVVQGSLFTYAQGQLVLWSPKAEALAHGLQTLTLGKFNKLALANPKLAPYGAAAHQVLQSLGITNISQNKWIQGENISQTYQFVRSGNVDLGLVAWSQVKLHNQPNQGAYLIIPENLYQPIYQDAVLLKRASKNKAALAFIQFLKQDKAHQIILSSGYKLPTQLDMDTEL